MHIEECGCAKQITSSTKRGNAAVESYCSYQPTNTYYINLVEVYHRMGLFELPQRGRLGFTEKASHSHWTLISIDIFRKHPNHVT